MSSEPDHQLSPATADSAIVFDGDTGTLKADTRHVLVQLLLGPSMDAKRHSKLWPVLLRDESVIRSRLHDLFLDLMVDRELQVAFTRQLKSDKGEFPILLRKASLNFLESALLLHLRLCLTQADAQVERAVISYDEMRDHLLVFENSSSVDRSGFAGKIDNAIVKVHKHGFLSKLGRGDTGRFEISPTLKLLMSADEIQELTRIYKDLANGGNALDGDDDASDDVLPPTEEDLQA